MRREEREQYMTEINKCYGCGRETQFVHRIPFRIRGTPGLWKLVVGEWAEFGEETVSFDVYVSSSCGEVRLSTDGKTRCKLPGKSILKKCCPIQQRDTESFRRMPMLGRETTGI